MRGGHISVSSLESERAGPDVSAGAHLRLKKKKMPPAVPPPEGSDLLALSCGPQVAVFQRSQVSLRCSPGLDEV